MAVLRVLALAAVTLSGSALAQTSEPAPAPRSNTIVYKCVNPDGSVIYDENPCSSDPKKMQILDTAGALLTGRGGFQDDIAAGVADSDCRDNAYKTTHEASEARIAESNKHIADYRQQRETLQSQINYAGAAASPDMASSVDRLEAAITSESEFQQKEAGSVEQAYQTALKACDKAKEQRAEARATQATTAQADTTSEAPPENEAPVETPVEAPPEPAVDEVPAEPAEPTSSVPAPAPAPAAEPAEPAEPAAAEPAEPVEPAAAEPAEPAESAEPAEPADQPAAAEPAEPPEAAEPADDAAAQEPPEPPPPADDDNGGGGGEF
jgi:hypothetical protein